MSAIDLAALFVRFRDAGDVAALARIFDRTAPDLLDLARHLTRRHRIAGLEDDLVQATFVTAIENRASFDANRPLEPWLAGILANHVLYQRRREMRVLPDAIVREIVQAELRDGSHAAIDLEVREEVTRALARLPERYRDLVEQRIVGGLRASEVAGQRGRSAAVVRSQLHRGLSLLRQALPPGLIAGFLGIAIARGLLRAGRKRVLAEASLAVAPTGAGTLGLTIGGGLLMSKPLLFGLCILALVIAGFVMLRTEAPDANADEGARVPTPPVAVPSVAAAETTESGAPIRDPAGRAPASEPAAPALLPASYRAALAAVRGRVLEADGSPVAAAPIALLAFDRSDLTTSLTAMRSPEEPLPESARALTDAAGRFEIREIEPAGLHALSVDAAGPRATLKVIDAPLGSGATIDLGDILLGAVCNLRGRIVAAEGEPIAGARVRIVPNLPIVLGATSERVTPSTLVLTEQAAGPRVEALPIWVRRLLPRLPLPSARSDAEGRFEIPGAMTGSMVAWVDAEGFVPAMFGPLSLNAERPRDLGDLELVPGVMLSGRLADASGRALAGIELAAGTSGSLPSFAFLTERGVSDGQGRFTVPHLAEDGRKWLAARPSRASHWRAMSVPESQEAEVALTLPEPCTHALAMKQPDGTPCGIRSLRLAPDTATGPRLSFQRDDEWATPDFTVDANGCVTLRALFPGPYRASIELADGGTIVLGFEVNSKSDRTEVVVPAPRTLAFRVVDDATNTPIEHAGITVFSPVDPILEILEIRSDENGRCRGAPLPIAVAERLHIRVEHPAYATLRDEFVPSTEAPTEIRLVRGGSLAGAFTSEGSTPPQRMLVVLMPAREGVSPALPTLIAAQPNGEFSATGIAPERYDWLAYPNHLAGDWRTLASRVSQDVRLLQAEPEARGRITIETGQTARLDIEIVARGSARNGRIRGRVTSHGAPVLDARLHASTGRDKSLQSVAADGSYELVDVRPGSVVVTLYCGSFQTPDGINTLVTRTIELPVGGSATVDFQVGEHELPLRVVAHGAPVAGIAVELQPVNDAQESRWFSGRNTDLAGEVTLAANAPGMHRVVASDPRHGFAVREVTIPCPDARFVLELDPGISFSGRIELDPAIGRVSECASLLAEVVIANAPLHRHVEIDPATGAFRVEHLPPGRVVFSLPGGPSHANPIAVECTADRSDAVLRFEP